jgi:hypothetical protein
VSKKRLLSAMGIEYTKRNERQREAVFNTVIVGGDNLRCCFQGSTFLRQFLPLYAKTENVQKEIRSEAFEAP